MNKAYIVKSECNNTYLARIGEDIPVYTLIPFNVQRTEFFKTIGEAEEAIAEFAEGHSNIEYMLLNIIEIYS